MCAEPLHDVLSRIPIGWVQQVRSMFEVGI